MRRAAARSFSWSVLAMMSAIRREMRACLAICTAACSSAYPTAPAAAATRSTPSSCKGRVRNSSASSATVPLRASGFSVAVPREPCSHHRRSSTASSSALMFSARRSRSG